MPGELLSVYRDHGVVPKSSRTDNFNRASEDLTKYQFVSPGDLVVNKMKAWQGSVAISDYQGIVSPAYYVYRRVGDVDSRYIHYLLRSPQYVAHMGAISSGIRPNQWDLDPEQFRKMPLALPSVEEQAAVATYLDRETAQIDAFIAKNEELVALLEERERGQIGDAVTRGLGSTTDFRAIGSGWLDRMPSTWDFVAIKVVASVALGKMLQVAPRTDADRELDYLRAANVQPGGVLDLSNVKRMCFSPAEARSLDLRRGDVVVVEGGVGGYGRAAYVPESIAGMGFQNSIVRLRPRSGLDGRFLAYALRHLRDRGYIEMVASVASMPHFTAEKVAETCIPVPPMAEQVAIADHLDRSEATLRHAVRVARRSVELAKERRSALISAAVTGKIDGGEVA